MSMERIIAEVQRRAVRPKRAYTLTVKPRGSEPIVAQRVKLHSGFLELEFDVYRLNDMETPAGTRTTFVPFEAIDWVSPTWL